MIKGEDGTFGGAVRTRRTEHEDDHDAHIAQQQAAAVAEKDRRGLEVVRQEPERRPEKGDAQDDPGERQ